MAIATALGRRPSSIATALLVTAALVYPVAMAFTFLQSDPRLLLGPWYPLIFCAVGPALLFGIALALTTAGVRFSKWAIVILLVLVAIAAALAYWGWQAALWGV